MPLIIRQSFGQVRLFFLFVVLALLGHQAHQNLLKSFESEELPLFVETLPNEEYVRFQWLNFKELAGDYYWLRVVSHFGDTRAQAVDYPLLLKLLKLVTTLKPHFRPAYELAGVALPMVEGYVDGAIDILEKGVQEEP